MNKVFPIDQSKLIFLFCLSLLILGLINIGLKIFDIGNTTGWDFRVIWISGKIWADQLNPYILDVFNQYNTFDPKGFEHLWAYPPNWSIITIPISLLSFPIAVIVWNLFSVFMLVYALYAFSSHNSYWKNKCQRTSYLLFVVSIVFLSQAMANNLFLGQTTLLVMAGATFYFHGLLSNSPKRVIVGAVLLALKPTLALVILPSYFLFSWNARSISIVIVAVMLMSLPALFLTGAVDTITGFLDGLSVYSKFKVNSGAELTGLAHLIYVVTGNNVSGILLTILGSVTTFIVLSILMRSNSAEKERLVYGAFYCIITILFVFTPLHSYDWIVIFLLLPILPQLNKLLMVVSAIAMLLVFRSGNLESVLKVSSVSTTTFMDTTLLTAVSMILLSGMVVFLVQEVRYEASKRSASTHPQ